MPAKPTRTLNPLPFLELEPHRFEDLVRQLAYDFREWQSLEAIGRSGGDEGIDIRGTERVVPDDDHGDGDGDDGGLPAVERRTWVFQCKREKRMGPQRVRDAIVDSLAPNTPIPHGFVLAVACDLSKKARDAFREEMVARGVEEFFVWARGELEDLLFQPRNDRLLFAYFGLSLQPRRRSMASAIRSQVALKKQLRRLFENDENRSGADYLLLRDPADSRYPRKPKKKGEQEERWCLCKYLHLRHPRHLSVLSEEYLAWVPVDQRGWDALTDHNLVPELARGHLRAKHAWEEEDANTSKTIHRDFWEEYVPKSEQAFFRVMRPVPLERIIAIDPIGDGYYPIPHVFVDFDASSGAFEGERYSARLERAGQFGGRVELRAEAKTRVEHFPNPLPVTVFPPPAGFDHGVLKRRRRLSVDSRDELAALLKSQDDAGSSVEGRAEVSNTTSKHAREFRRWRDDIVLPAFGAVTEHLRSRGLGARIAVREDSAKHPWARGHESVELRVEGRAGMAHNPDYRPRGHVRYELERHDGSVKHEASPPPSTMGALRREHRHPQPGDISPAHVERHVLDMLRRLHGER